MNSELKITFRVDSLFSLLERVGTFSHVYDDWQHDPLSVLIHNKILEFKAEELDSCQETVRFRRSLFDLTISSKNNLVLSAFLKVGAFKNKISEESKWILENTKDYEAVAPLIMAIESDLRNKNAYKLKSSEKNSIDLFEYIISFSPKNDHLIDKYYKDFFNKEKFIDFVLNNLGSNYSGDRALYILDKLKKDNVDINENYPLNKLVLISDISNKNFFISSDIVKRIDELIKYGFEFNDQKYYFKGDNLFMSVLKSDRVDLVNTIIPHVKNISPQNGNWEEQDSMVEKLLKGDVKKDLYLKLKSQYLKLKMEQDLIICGCGKKVKTKI